MFYNPHLSKNRYPHVYCFIGSLNNEQNYRKMSEDKMSICKKTAGSQSGTFPNLNSACLKELVHVKIFLFQDMLNESERYWNATNGLYVLRGLTLSLV